MKYHVKDNNVIYFGNRPLLIAIAPDDAAIASHAAAALQAAENDGALCDSILKMSADNNRLEDRVNDLLGKLAKSDARVDYLEDVIQQLDGTLEEALHQLRICYK